jgi:Leucine-rich repeat (LRR) protein
LTVGSNSAPDASHCLQLECLRLRFNELAVLPDLSQHQKLHALTLQNNWVETMPLLPESARLLVACGNRLTDITSLQHLPSMEELCLENNLIAKNPFDVGVPSGLQGRLKTFGNPICDTCLPEDFGACEDQRNVLACGFDQATCDGASQLPCADWCHAAGPQFLRSLDVDLNGIIAGAVETSIAKSFYAAPEMGLDSHFMTMGLLTHELADAGVVPDGANILVTS